MDKNYLAAKTEELPTLILKQKIANCYWANLFALHTLSCLNYHARLISGSLVESTETNQEMKAKALNLDVQSTSN